jgi:hypothetical protein
MPQQRFPTQWKKAVILPVYKKVTTALIQNCKPATLFNNFSKVFKFNTQPKSLIILKLNSIIILWFLLNLNILLPT